MQKVGYILIITALTIGCSVTKVKGPGYDDGLKDIENEKLIDNILKKNITTRNFYIQKAEIEISGSGETNKLFGSIKFENPDKFLFSLRSRTGLEIVRIFISDDTILVNDRINRKLYCGRPSYLKMKYGLSASVLPVMFGDFIDGEILDNIKLKCLDGNFNTARIVEGMKLMYYIDCRIGKTVLMTTESSLKLKEVEIRYKDFFKKDKSIIPGKIEYTNFKREESVIIVIKKIELPWDGNIDFIPGNKYEIIQL